MGQNNVMRWNCEKQGCFNIKKRPKLGEFASCFPGKIAFGDVDGLVEIGGAALMLEWKPAPVPLSAGQRIAFEKLTEKNDIWVVCVAGDAETMEVSHVAWCDSGCLGSWRRSTMDGLKKEIREWASWAASR